MNFKDALLLFAAVPLAHVQAVVLLALGAYRSLLLQGKGVIGRYRFHPHALTTRAPALCQVGVLQVVGMALRAVRFQKIGRWQSISPKCVFAGRYWLQMGRIAAGWIFAEMVKKQSGGNRADKQFIGQPMRSLVVAGVPYAAVAHVPVMPPKWPAFSRASGFNFSPEPFFQRNRQEAAVASTYHSVIIPRRFR